MTSTRPEPTTGTYTCRACGTTSDPLPAAHIQAAEQAHRELVHGNLWGTSAAAGTGGTR